MREFLKLKKARSDMGFLENRELGELKREKVASSIKLKADKEIFAHELQNGLGKEIKEELRNPRKPNRWVAFKLKFAKLKLVLKERLLGIEIK